MDSEATRLLKEAHRDAPSHAQRVAMWEGIAATVAAGASVAPAAKGLGALGKLLLGVVAVGAIGGGAWVARSRVGATAPAPAASPRVAVVAPSLVGAVPSLPAAPVGSAAVVDELGDAPPSPPVSTHPKAQTRPSTTASPVAAPAIPAEDPLVREARLIAEARAALLRGEADRALRLARSARAVDHPSLEPEELALEVRALRELGRVDEASAVERSLSARFPDHALAH